MKKLCTLMITLSALALTTGMYAKKWTTDKITEEAISKRTEDKIAKEKTPFFEYQTLIQSLGRLDESKPAAKKAKWDALEHFLLGEKNSKGVRAENGYLYKLYPTLATAGGTSRLSKKRIGELFKKIKEQSNDSLKNLLDDKKAKDNKKDQTGFDGILSDAHINYILIRAGTTAKEKRWILELLHELALTLKKEKALAPLTIPENTYSTLSSQETLDFLAQALNEDEELPLSNPTYVPARELPYGQGE